MGLSLLLFVAGLFFFRKKKLPRVVPILWFGAAAGLTGWILDLFNSGVGWMATTLGQWIGGAIFVLAAAIVWMTLQLGHDYNPKNKGSAGRATAVAALVLPVLATSMSGRLPEAILALGGWINGGGNALFVLAFGG